MKESNKSVQYDNIIFPYIQMCFSANFVTNDLEEEPAQFKEEKLKNQRRRSVTFNEEVEV